MHKNILSTTIFPTQAPISIRSTFTFSHLQSHQSPLHKIIKLNYDMLYTKEITESA